MAQEQGLTWTVLTHEHQERSNDWYWTLGLVALIGAALSIYFGNVMLALILLIGLTSIGYLSFRGPREHAVRIDSRGVTVDGTLYPYNSIASFAIGPHAGQESLILAVRSYITPHIGLPLEGVSPDVVRMTLTRYIPEIEHKHRVVDALADAIGL